MAPRRRGEAVTSALDWANAHCRLPPLCRRLLAILRQHFLEAGGTLLEHTSFKSATVYDDGVAVQLLPAAVAAPRMEAGDVNRPMALQQAAREQQQGTGSTAHRTAACSSSSSGSIAAAASSPSPPAQRRRQLTTRLLVDCMGHYSPIVKQSRAGQQPDGMLLVVGGCFEGVPPEHNTTADLLATVCDAADDQQLFFEAFPAADSPSSRTVYMFEVGWLGTAWSGCWRGLVVVAHGCLRLLAAG